MKIDFLFYRPDRVSTINEVIFGILSPERIREMSTCEIYRHVTGNNTDQPGTQRDSRLGVIDKGRICQTCLNDYTDCPGHMGHINLAKPVFHPLYLNTILVKLLGMICLGRCSRLQIDPANRAKIKAIKSKIPKARFSLAKAASDEERKRNSMKCTYCGTKLPSKIKRHSTLLSKLLVCYESGTSKSKAGEDAPKFLERKVNAEYVLSKLKGIPDDDLELMGFHPELSRPEWMIWTVLPFPPITVRPPTKLDIGRYGDDDLTIKLNDISKTNNNIKVQLQKISTESDATRENILREIEFLWEILQTHITTYIDNESNKKTAVHRSGRPLKALVQRIKTKEGRVRWNLMGKRVDDSGRTVITPDNNINLDEIGIPKKIATNLVKPVTVTPFNIEQLQTMVHRGLDDYPGAKYVVPKGSKFKKPLKIMNAERRSELRLAVGDVVYRNILDGDWVLVNRQPSLHRMSMMAHRVVILKGETFRLNVQSVTPYNADFDGDEMNIHVPQSLEAENEMARLSHLATQIISPKDSLPVMGLVQDSLLGLYLFGQSGFLSVKNAMKMFNDLGLLDDHRFEVELDSGRLYAQNQMVINETLPKITVVDAKKRDANQDIVKYGKLMAGKSIPSGMLKNGKPGLFHIAWSDYGPGVAKDLFDNLARIATNWLMISGFSVGILDCIPNVYIKDRICSIVLIYDKATQMLVDYHQLKRLPVFSSSGWDVPRTMLSEIEKSKGYTFTNKSRIEGLLGEIYHQVALNRIIFEIHRLKRTESDSNFPARHKETIMSTNFGLVLEYWSKFIESVVLKLDGIDDIRDNIKATKTMIDDDIIGQHEGNYYGHFYTIIQKFRGIDGFIDLIGITHTGGVSENEIQDLEATAAFVQTLIYIVPGAPDMADRLEEKLYELTQKSTGVVNDIIAENTGFYEYQGLDEKLFKYRSNGFKTMFTAASKGKAENLGMIAGLLGQQDQEGKRQGNFFYRRSLPHYPKDSIEPKARGYVQNSFLDGLTTLEYFSHAQSGRLNQIDKTIKSVTWETPVVVLEDNNIHQVTIGEWIDDHLLRSAVRVEHRVEQEMEYLRLDNEAYIPTCDEDGRVSWGKITAITRHDPGKELYQVTTAGGRSVIVTESKSLLIYNPQLKKFLHTSTPEVKVGDYMPVTAQLPDAVATSRWIDVGRYVDNIVDSRKLLPDQLPLDHATGRFLGVMLGEGAYITADDISVNSSLSVIGLVKYWLTAYNIPNTQSYNGYSVTAHSRQLCQLLCRLMASGSESCVPDISFTAPNDFVAGMLCGYISHSGMVIGDRLIVKTMSRSLVDGVSMLCSRLGIFGEISESNEWYNLTIQGQWLWRFKDQITLVDNDKQVQLDKIVSTIDTIPTQNDVVLDKIVEIGKVDVSLHPKVYDLTVPSTLNFGLANGLHVVDTAETGYLQRKLIKMMEGLTVHYDGTVRNSSRNVIQKLYGGDAIDPQQLETVPIEYKDLDKRFYFTAGDLEGLESVLSQETAGRMSDGNYLDQINKQHNEIQSGFKTIEQLYGHLDLFRDNEETIYAYLPVNFERLIHNNLFRFRLDIHTKTSLDPVYLVEEVEKLLDRIRSCNTLNADDHLLFFGFCARTNLSVRELIVKYRYTREAFQCLLEDIYLKYCRSLIPPGESIGIISAQSIGEPCTQMTLNKFHAAGVGKARSKLQGGVPRLHELLGLTRKEKMKTPSITMKVSSWYETLHTASRQDITGIDMHIINQLKSFEFKNLIKSSEICYDPGHKQPPKLANRHILDDSADFYSSYEGGGLPWVVSFQVKIDKKREIRADTIYNAIEGLIRGSNKYKVRSPLNYRVLVAYDGLTVSDSLKCYVAVRCSSSLFDDDDKKSKRETLCTTSDRESKRTCKADNIMCNLIDLKNDISRLSLKGSRGVTDVFVEREAGQKTILTIGGSMGHIIENPVFSQIVDVNRMTSNDVMEIECLYGIEAARNCFINEMYTTLSSQGRINIRHIELLADNMSHLGELLSVNRFGVKRGNNEPLHRASFEETTKQFIESSLHTEKDPMVGPSANVMFGQFINSGTNAFSIMLDTEKLQELSKSEIPQPEWPQMSIDPYDEHAVREIKVDTTTKLHLNRLVIDDLFVFKFDSRLILIKVD